MLESFNIYCSALSELNSDKKQLINTINAYSYYITRSDASFKKALQNCDVLIPDGVSIVAAIKWLQGKTIKKIAGADLFTHELERLNTCGGKCMFLGSSNNVLSKIKEKASQEYPDVIVKTFSPPYKPVFSSEDNDEMVNEVNSFIPDVLFVGMTAPKQEKWAYSQFEKLDATHVCCIGAVFDFYAGTVNRAPGWMINNGLEWLYRLSAEPKRMWKRYLIGNTVFVWNVIREKLGLIK